MICGIKRTKYSDDEITSRTEVIGRMRKLKNDISSYKDGINDKIMNKGEIMIVWI